MAAPALAASVADCAICCGVTGTAGFLPGVSADPVTAHEIMTLRCIRNPRRVSPCRHLRPTEGGAPSTDTGRYGHLVAFFGRAVRSGAACPAGTAPDRRG